VGHHPQVGGGAQAARAEDTPPPPPAAAVPLPEQARGGSNLLALAIEAARQNATLGEISTALEIAFGRYDTVPTPVTGVYAKAYAGDPRYAQLLEGVEAVGRAEHELGERQVEQRGDLGAGPVGTDHVVFLAR
jgi:methylmalonyl-CoA mutase